MYKIRLLDVIERSEDESNETLMSRVEISISQELNIPTSNITKNDKVCFFLVLNDNYDKFLSFY